MTKRNSKVVEQVLGLHYRSSKVVKLIVRLHHENATVVKLELRLHYRCCSSNLEVFWSSELVMKHIIGISLQLIV